MNAQLSMFDRAIPIPLPERGTFDNIVDGPRVASQRERVLEALQTGNRFTLKALAIRAGGSEAGVSARIRQLRNDYGYRIDKERIRADGGTWWYWLVKE